MRIFAVTECENCYKIPVLTMFKLMALSSGIIACKADWVRAWGRWMWCHSA